MMKKIEIYPTTIYFENFYNDKYIKTGLDICNILREKSILNDCRSVRNGWQSDKQIYNIPHFAKLADLILNESKKIINSDKIVPFITSMWINIHDNKGFNHLHTHPGSWYSGAFYLKCPENCGQISFTDPRPAAEMSIYESFTIGKNIHCIGPSAGDLIMFPSWLPHLVEQNLSDDSRISISFNIELDI
jgi:uncharacterized protein (TIGR02466 family)